MTPLATCPNLSLFSENLPLYAFWRYPGVKHLQKFNLDDKNVWWNGWTMRYWLIMQIFTSRSRIFCTALYTQTLLPMPMPRLLNKAYICVYYRLSSISHSLLLPLLLLWNSPKEKAATVVGAPLWCYSSLGLKGKAFLQLATGFMALSSSSFWPHLEKNE